MKWTSILAIYCLFWVMAAFIVMPFGLRTHDELGDGEHVEKIPGQADSAPVNFRPGLIARRASLLALAMFAVFYLNYVNGWVSTEDLDMFKAPNFDGTK